MPNAETAPTGNQLLDSLQPSSRAAVRAHLTNLQLERRHSVIEPNERIEHVHFPIDAVVSMVTVMDDDVAIEVATVGHEGMVGVPIFLGADTMTAQAFCQVAGASLRMSVTDFRELANRLSDLRSMLNRYTQALFTQYAQTAGCNRAHPLEERCARWLLQTHDRVGRDEFPLTQEFLGQMLGVRRGTVNLSAAILERSGYISYRDGEVAILDRKGLESASCECYGIVHDEFTRLLGLP